MVNNHAVGAVWGLGAISLSARGIILPQPLPLPLPLPLTLPLTLPLPLATLTDEAALLADMARWRA